MFLSGWHLASSICNADLNDSRPEADNDQGVNITKMLLTQTQSLKT